MRHGTAVGDRRTFASILVSVIFVALTAGSAHSWHGSGDVTVVAIDPVTPTTLYAGTVHDGVFKSIDEGTTWSATALANIYVGALSIDPTSPGTVYAATWPGRVYKSTDGGGSWRAVNVGLANLNISSVSVDGQGFVYAVLWDRGIFKSTDGAETVAVDRSDYPIEFTTSNMPDPQFDGLSASLNVHRVKPVFPRGCPNVSPIRALVLCTAVRFRRQPPVIWSTRTTACTGMNELEGICGGPTFRQSFGSARRQLQDQ